MGAEEQKRNAALRALEDVRAGMRLGLGSGSTSAHFVDVLCARARDEGLELVCVPTSEVIADQARAGGLKLATLDEVPELDLVVDGADEFDSDLVLVKGGGGALLREKIVASAAREMTVIADAGKHVDTLGAFALPVEVVPFGADVTAAQLQKVCGAFGCRGAVARRGGDDPFITDGGHYIYDCAFGEIADPRGLGPALNAILGVVEHGLFIDMATRVIVGNDEGTQVIG